MEGLISKRLRANDMSALSLMKLDLTELVD